MSRVHGRAPGAAGDLDDDVRLIIVEGDTDRLIKRAKEVGQSLVRAKLTMAQIRGVFGIVRRLEMRWTERAQPGDQAWAARQLRLLEPKLEYQAERHRQVRALKEVLVPAIRCVDNDRTRFGRFVEFFEAILAYFVAAGGKTN